MLRRSSAHQTGISMSLNGLRLVRTNEGWSSTVIGLVSLDRLTHQLRTVKNSDFVVNDAELMRGLEHNVAQNIVVLRFDTEPFKRTPVPVRVQVRGDSRGAGQASHSPACLKPIFSVLEPQPVATGHVSSINRKTQVVRRIPFSNRLFDIADVEITSALRGDAVALHYATFGNRQTNVHQNGLAGLYAVDR